MRDTDTDTIDTHKERWGGGARDPTLTAAVPALYSYCTVLYSDYTLTILLLFTYYTFYDITILYYTILLLHYTVLYFLKSYYTFLTILYYTRYIIILYLLYTVTILHNIILDYRQTNKIVTAISVIRKR